MVCKRSGVPVSTFTGPMRPLSRPDMSVSSLVSISRRTSVYRTPPSFNSYMKRLGRLGKQGIFHGALAVHRRHMKIQGMQTMQRAFQQMFLKHLLHFSL